MEKPRPVNAAADPALWEAAHQQLRQRADAPGLDLPAAQALLAEALAQQQALLDQMQRLPPTAARVLDGVATTTVDSRAPKRAEAEILPLNDEIARQTEDKYRTLFNSMNEGVAINQLLRDDHGRAVDVRFLELNPAFEQKTGLEHARTVGQLASKLLPIFYVAWLEGVERAFRNGRPERFEQYAPDINRWYIFHITPLREPDLFAVFYDDITARKQAEAHLVLLSEVSEDLAHLTDIDATMHALCAKLGAYFGVAVCAFSPVNEAAGTVAVQHVWHQPDARSPAGVYRLDEYHSAEVRQAMRAGRPEVVRDTADLPAAAADRLAALHIGAFVNLPFVRRGQWLFTLSLAASAPHNWRADELDLLRELTARIWTGLERARVEAALRHSEEQFRTVANLVPDLLWRTEPNNNTTWYNQRWLDYTGQTLAEAAGDGWAETIHPDDRERSARQYRAAVQSGQPLQQEHRIRSAGGVYRWFVVAALPARDAQGTVTHWFGAATDIEDRKQVEAGLRTFATALEGQVAERTHELRESRDLLQSVFDTNLILMFVYRAVRDAAGTILDFEFVSTNRAFDRYAGRTDLVGRRYAEEYPGVRTTGIFDRLVQAVETGQPQTFEHYYGHEGFDAWFITQFVQLGDGAVATSLDITERKTAEQQRLRNLHLLEQAEAVAQLGSWDYDLATGQFLWSGGMYHLFGLSPDQPVQPPVYLDYVLDEDRPLAEQLVQQITAGAGNLNVTLRLQVGGDIKTVRIKSEVFHNAQGQPVRVLGVDLDISALQRLEGENLRLRLRQQQALFEAVQAAEEDERRRMAESLHNGIGQLLYAAKLQLDLLPHAPEPSPRQQVEHLLGEAIRQTRALSHELTPAILEDYGLEKTLESICRTLNGPGLRWRCHLNFEEGPALPLPLQLAVYRLAQELAQNVLKHAHATEATLEAEVLPAWMVLRVEDNGRGFDPAHTGDGLGLRATRSRVALLGGHVHLTTAPGQGTQCQIRIPLPPPAL